jgi:hypothetical protein
MTDMKSKIIKSLEERVKELTENLAQAEGALEFERKSSKVLAGWLVKYAGYDANSIHASAHQQVREDSKPDVVNIEGVQDGNRTH